MTNFKEFNLSNEVSMAIADMGFTEASEIQAKAIPGLLEGKDIIGQAQTGSGKTAAFAIPLIEKLDPENTATQALILCPTRELVLQVTEELRKLCKYHKNLSVLSVYGGQDIKIQLKQLKKDAQIVVASPGRAMDHLRRKSLKLGQMTYLVFDEADQMLDMGFREDMETIVKEIPKERQTVMFSATMNKEIMGLMKKFQKNPEHINTVGQQEQSKQIKQLYFHINSASKLEALKRLLSYHKISSGLIFCNTKDMVDKLAKELAVEKYSTASLHGDIDQKKREKTMRAFREGKIEILIATDVAARGLDINDLEVVINYDLPRFDQDYVHRIGRTGRAGKMGLALSLIVGRELDHMERIARKSNMQIESAQVPEIKDLLEKNFDTIKAQIQNTEFDRKDLKKYFALLNKLELFDYKEEELAAILLKTLLDQESQSYGHNVNFAPDKNASKKEKSRGRSGQPRSRNRGNNRSGERRGKDSGERRGKDSRRGKDGERGSNKTKGSSSFKSKSRRPRVKK